MDIKLSIIFDLGGVLFDWNPRHLYRKLFPGDAEKMEWFLSNICTQDWNVKQDAGRPFSEAVAELIERHPEYEDLIRAYDIRWEEMVTGAIGASVDILAALRQNNYRLYALSNWSVEKFCSVRTRYEFLDWFDAILISGEVGLVKPDSRIYLILLEKTGLSAPQCLFIDDSLENVMAAQKLGFNTIHFRTPEQLRDELAAMGILQ
jgi:2-haloacid dehalogenase